MMFYTHLVFGFLLSLLSMNFINVENILMFFSGVLIGSIIVDIDSFKSFIGRKSLGISFLVQLITGHRGIFHSLLFAVLFSGLLLLFNATFAIGFFIGYISHLMIDTLNIQGIRWFYPFSKLRFKGFIEVNGFAETLIFFLILVLDVVYAYYLFFH